MIVCGIDTDSLPDQFHGEVAGRTLIVDGDGPAYRVAATVKTIPTAIRRFQQDMLTQMFLNQAMFGDIHLTHEQSKKAGRFNIIAEKPYQGNRSGKSKPPLLSEVRRNVAIEENWHESYTVTMHDRFEADDGMIMSAYRLKEDGVIWSDDKDLRMTPYAYYDQYLGKILAPDPFGSLWLHTTETGSVKLHGHSLLFFWAQLMMGDTADNIKGLKSLHGKLCGPASAYNFLREMRTIEDVANSVIGAYRAINQNPLPEGWLLWLLRYEGDSFWQYLQECKLSPANTDFINDCVRRNWFVTPTQHEEDSDDPPF